MSRQQLARWGGTSLILTGVLFGAGGILLVLIPGGGVNNPLVPLLYYLGTVISVFAFVALITTLGQTAGALGFSGFLLATMGAILYSGPQWALVAGSAGAPGWHDVWGFSMGNILLAGPLAFFVGMILLGYSSRRAGNVPKWAAMLLMAGSGIWLVAFFLSFVPGLLTIASLIICLSLTWMGSSLWRGRAVSSSDTSFAT